MPTLRFHTEKSKETRSYIAEALIRLMKRLPLESIKISQIVKTAGVSRMTYYLYYENKIDVLYDYINEISKDYNREISRSGLNGQLRNCESLLYCFRYFKKYSYIVLTLEHQNLYYIFQNALNQYMEHYVIPHYIGEPLELYAYSGALANLYLKWIQDGFQKTEEEMANLAYRLCC